MHQFSNHLQFESSPYLLQHAHNPVEWHAWNADTLLLAKNRNLPVLVSIGYAACHWCHVMERESFEDVVVAKFMNDHFTNIKIDREERPDIDHVLMEAVQTMSGQGGWPLNVFLTPDLKPFYGGTYFPPVRMHARPSWLEVLQSIHQAWQTNNENISLQADKLYKHMEDVGDKWLDVSDGIEDDNPFQEINEQLLSKADHQFGGFGRAPKFPQWFCLQYMLASGYFYNNNALINHVKLSLDNLITGGIYDQVGGGISRYSTDEQWLVPHFEKMLYDNAFLISTLSEAYQLTGEKRYADYIRYTIRFLQREMLVNDEGYYAALDADSEGVEGKFYVWSYQEVKEILSSDAEAFCADFGITEEGNWEGTNILHYNFEKQAHHVTTNANPKELLDRWKAQIQLLLTERGKRIRPATDIKQLLGWNALLVSSYCKAYGALQDSTYYDEAIRLFDWLVKTFKQANGSYLHTYANKASIDAFLDDYAYLMESALNLHAITGNDEYKETAKELLEYVVKHFYDADTGLFYFTADYSKDSLLRTKDLMDNALTSGNSSLASSLQQLGALQPELQYNKMFDKMVDGMKRVVVKYPESFAHWAFLLLKKSIGMHRIELSGDSFNTLLREISKIYLPNKVLQVNIGGQKKLNNTQNLPENAGILSVCNNFTCFPPLGSIQELKNFLKKDLIQ